MTLSPIQVLRQAIRAVPAVKYALGIAGIVAVFAIVRGFSVSYRVAVFGVIVMLVVMTVLVVFARISAAGPGFFYWPAVVLTWFSLAIVMGTAGLLFTSVFFERPIDLRRWVDPSIANDREESPTNSLGKQIAALKPDGEVLQAISALVQYSLAKPSAEQIKSAVGQLKLAIVRPDPPSRPVMKALLESVKTLRNADLHTEFSQGELRGKDIVSVDLSNTDLRNVKFDGAFMIETDLSGSDLGGASFAKAAIRNVTFAGAKMYGTDMTGADWFNARGLTLDQITNLKPGTVLRCPANHGTFSEAQFLQFLPRVYGYPFDSWSGDVQDQLRTVWRDYGKSGGLCHTVAQSKNLR